MGRERLSPEASQLEGFTSNLVGEPHIQMHVEMTYNMD